MEPIYFINPKNDEHATIETLEKWMGVKELPEEHKENFRAMLKKQKAENISFWENREDLENRNP